MGLLVSISMFTWVNQFGVWVSVTFTEEEIVFSRYFGVWENNVCG